MATLNAVETLDRIESILTEAQKSGGSDAVAAALADGDWQIVQAALYAIRLHPHERYVAGIEAVLASQDKLDIYGQKDEVGWPAGFPIVPTNHLVNVLPQTVNAWKCRWRVKQAACHALGAIGAACGAAAVGPQAVGTLCRYVVETTDDYQVRAAACMALGQIGDPAGKAALEIGAKNDETCTRIEAQKALASLANLKTLKK